MISEKFDPDLTENQFKLNWFSLVGYILVFLFWKPEKQIAPIKLYQYKEKDNYVEGEDTNNKTKITNN